MTRKKGDDVKHRKRESRAGSARSQYVHSHKAEIGVGKPGAGKAGKRGGAGGGASADARHDTGRLTDLARRTMRWAIFPIAMILGVLIRLMPEVAMAAFGGGGIANYCVWVDEVWTLMIAQLPFRAALYLIHHFDAVPPLSYLFLRMTPQLDDGTILRIVPGAFSALALGAFLWFGARYLKRDETWLVGVLLALSPIHFWYALNLRYYGLMELVAALFIVATARLIAIGRGIRARDRALPGGTFVSVHLWLFFAAAGLLTHHLFALAILAAVVAMIASLGRRTAALFARPVQYAWALAPLLYWAQVFLWQRGFVGGYKLYLEMPGVDEVIAAFRDFLLLYAQPPSVSFAVIAGVIIVFPLAVLGFNWYARFRRRELPPVILPVCIWIALIPPVASYLAMIATGNPQVLSRRYLIPSGIAFLVLWTLGCLKIKPAAIRIALIFAVVMFNLFGLYGVLIAQAPPNYRTVAEFILQESLGDTWVVSREPANNLVVNEASCLAAYLPETPRAGFKHLTVSPEGPTAQVFALSQCISRMSERAIRGYSRYYPEHISIAEFQARIANAARWYGAGARAVGAGGQFIPRGVDSLPDTIIVIYPSAALNPPTADEDMGPILGEDYAYAGRAQIGGITVDKWALK